MSASSASSAGDMAWKVFWTGDQTPKRYLDGNSGRNGTSVFEPHSSETRGTLALVETSRRHLLKLTAAVAFSLDVVAVNGALVVQLILRGRGDAPLALPRASRSGSTSSRRLKGATWETASRSSPCCPSSAATFLSSCASWRSSCSCSRPSFAYLSSDASNYVHNVDDAEVLDPKNIALHHLACLPRHDR